MTRKLQTGPRHQRHSLRTTALVICCLIPLCRPDLTHAQATSPITSSGLGTTVTTSGNVHAITGGTRPGSGPNLFHSFGEFGVPTNHVANFLNESGLTTSNILGRVTGGNPSNIFGTIQTTGFGSANLFLMNPAGIVFGPNASLNVGGSVSFTTADYLRLADGAKVQRDSRLAGRFHLQRAGGGIWIPRLESGGNYSSGRSVRGFGRAGHFAGRREYHSSRAGRSKMPRRSQPAFQPPAAKSTSSVSLRPGRYCSTMRAGTYGTLGKRVQQRSETSPSRKEQASTRVPTRLGAS